MADPYEQLRSTLADRYRIERALGHGGMATVFLAEDLKHHRPVAVKVLRPELTALLGPDRFLREIEIAARLQHPHILTLLDSGAAGGLLYYVMPFVEGQSLRERLDRERQLPVDDALRIAREVASALDYAHRHEVVHRDIKPENILLGEGQAVVADFGIARAMVAAGGPKATPTGAVLGTPAYMSPEQAVGSSQLDGRSDLYSLGCVLYELLAGQPPFTGTTEESVIHQHLTVEPRPVTAVRSAVPGEVERALSRALAKAPADRFSTAAQFAEALAVSKAPEVRAGRRPTRARRLLIAAGVAVAVAITGLAAWQNRAQLRALFGGRSAVQVAHRDWILVAEFEGPPNDPGLASAVRDLVMAALDQSGIVAPVPRDQIQVALQMAGKPDTTRVNADLARELAYRSAVRAVVEGRISRLGEGYSIVLRVVDVEDAKVVLTVSDLARSQEDLIRSLGRLARQLREGLGERRSAIQATRPFSQVMTPSFEAYRKWLMARDLLGEGDNWGAIRLWREALALDSSFASARGGMGTAFSNLLVRDSAEVALAEALRRPERLTEVGRMTFEAQLALVKGDVPAAMYAYDRLLRMKLTAAQAATVYNNRGVALDDAYRHEEALENTKRAVELMPFGPSRLVLYNEFMLLVVLGRLDEARQLMPKLGDLKQQAEMWLAVGGHDWALAESLGMARWNNETTGRFWRTTGAVAIASADAARGSVGEAARVLQRAQTAAEAASDTGAAFYAWRCRMVLATVAGTAVPSLPRWNDRDPRAGALRTRAAWAAACGDTTLARRLLREAQLRPKEELARLRPISLGAEGRLAAKTGRWDEVARVLGPQAQRVTRLDPPYVAENRLTQVRWLLADAHERLGRPDSAAAYLEPLSLLMETDGREWDIVARGIPYAFANQRLVLLYVRMGRLEDAQRHWKIFSESFTRPDPEVRPLLEEARAALASAEGMAKSEKR